MAASDHLSPAQLRAHVQAHLENWPDSYDTPECADGQCWHATRGYVGEAVKDGHDAYFQTYDISEDTDRESLPHAPTHTVAGVQTSRGPYVVDLTHRQFDAKAPYPLIEPQHRFLKRKTMDVFPHVDTYGLNPAETYWDERELPDGTIY